MTDGPNRPTNDGVRDYRLCNGMDHEKQPLPDVTFRGEFVAHVDTWRTGTHRWSEINGYRTISGRLIVHSIGRSILEGELIHYAVFVFDTPESLMKKMGYSPVNARFFRKMGFETVHVS